MSAKTFILESTPPRSLSLLVAPLKVGKGCTTSPQRQKNTIFVSFAVDQNGWTRKGFYYKDLIKEALNYADYVGLNCLCGPYHIYKLISELDNLGEISQRIIAMPNSGYPSFENGRFFVYNDNKEYFSEKLLDLYKLNLAGVGGCCGTTPEYIKAFTSKISAGNISKNISQSVATFSKEDDFSKENLTHQSPFLQKLQEGKKVIAVELDSPVDGNFSLMRESAVKLKNVGCDIITVADSPLARAHADSIILSAKIKRELGIDVLPHLACRDRNHIGIKGALLGGNIEDLNNILIVTGDPLMGDKSQGKFSYNSFSLIEYVETLNGQVFQNNPFLISAALNTNHPNFDVELKRAEKKIKAGCKCFLSQPVYSEEGLAKLQKAKDCLDAYVLGGVMPCVSYKNATFLNNEVFGINIPLEIVERFKDKSREESEEIGLEISHKLSEEILKICDGLYVMIPLKRVDMICRLIENI